MDIHKNARLSFRSREDLARFVVQQGGTRKAAAAACSLRVAQPHDSHVSVARHGEPGKPALAS